MDFGSWAHYPCLQHELPTRTCKGVRIDQAIAICHGHRHRPRGLWSHDLFRQTTKGHYLPSSQVLPSLQRPFHSGSTYWEAYMYRRQDSLVVLILFLFMFLPSYVYFCFSSQRWGNILRCNLFFGFIGHFGLLKEIMIYISFFLSNKLHTINNQSSTSKHVFNRNHTNMCF